MWNTQRNVVSNTRCNVVSNTRCGAVSSTQRNTVSLVAVVVAACLAGPAAAQSAFSEPLDGIAWGASTEEVLAHHHERILDTYRTDIAGIRDPLQIDQMRRDADQVYRDIVDSREIFDTARTGYEVSVLQNEIAPNAGMSMIAVRNEGGMSLNYFVFVEDRLEKLIVTYDQVSLRFVGFEGFVERLESALGGPDATDWRVDDIGVRHMTRAVWSDGTTRVRAEDKSRMFASYLVVYSDASVDESLAANEDAGTLVRPSDTRDIGGMIRRMDTESAGTRDNSSVVDDLIGGPTEVELRVRSDEEAYGPDGEGSAFGDSALDDDDDLEDVEQVERPQRSSSSDDEEEEEEEEGGIIY